MKQVREFHERGPSTTFHKGHPQERLGQPLHEGNPKGASRTTKERLGQPLHEGNPKRSV